MNLQINKITEGHFYNIKEIQMQQEINGKIEAYEEQNRGDLGVMGELFEILHLPLIKGITQQHRVKQLLY